MAGTRGGVGRIAAMVIGLVICICLLLAGTARAGTYPVAQCGWGIGAELDPATSKTEGDAAYLHPGWCTAPPPGTAAGLAFEMGLAPEGDQGIARARWVAPPGTGFAAVRFTWAGELRGGLLQVAGIDDGAEFHGLAAAIESNPPHLVAVGVAGPAPAFEVRLECLLLGPWPLGCDRSSRSSVWLSGLTLTVRDPVPPQVTVGGALVAAGWHRGTAAVELAAEDPVGAGVYATAAAVDGSPVGSAPVACAVATIEGEVRATRLRPCPATATQAFEVDTTGLADGLHTLRGCAVDFGAGRGCAPEVQIQVDNSPPRVDFAAAPEGEVAAGVSDAFSGPAAGTISVRRADAETWTDLQTTLDRDGAGTATLRAHLPDLGPGAYFFRATASDGAGNAGSAQFRAAGSPVEIRRQVAGAGDGSGAGPAGRGDGRGAGRGRPTHLIAYLARAGRRASSGRLLVDSGTGGREASPRRPTERGPGGFRASGRQLAGRGSLGPDRLGIGRTRRRSLQPIASGPRRAGRGSLASGASAPRRARHGAPRPGTGASSLTVDYGSAVELRGRLTDGHGAGVANRPVAVVARAAGGAGGAPRRRRVVTDRAGRFALRLPPGTSRRVLVSFHGGGGLAPARRRPLALRVRAAVRLAAAPLRLRTGESVRLSGRVRPGAARIPARGKLVTVQYLERASGRWRPALVVRTGARGRFKARYRFRYVTGAAHIRLRATALPEAGWPYAAGSSPPLTLVVHGG